MSQSIYSPTRERALAVRNTALSIAGVFILFAILSGNPGPAVVGVLALIVAAIAHIR